MSFPLFILTGLAGSVSTLVVCLLLMKWGMRDKGFETHKAHGRSTPTLGGAAIIFGVFIMVAMGLLAGKASAEMFYPSMFWVIGLATLAGSVGAIDDLRRLGPKLRLGLQTLLGFVFTWAIASIDRTLIWPGLMADIGPYLGVAGTVLWLVVIMNATNFMDGSNGMASGAILMGFIGLSLHAAFAGDAGVALATILFCLPIAAFMFWNLQTRLFMGDCGALFLGFLYAAISVVMIEAGIVNIYTPVILIMPLLFDVFSTLVSRLIRKQNLLQPHREHLYQLAIKAEIGQTRTFAIYMMLSLQCLILTIIPVFFGIAASLGVLLFLIAAGISISVPMRRAAYEAGLYGERDRISDI